MRNRCSTRPPRQERRGVEERPSFAQRIGFRKADERWRLPGQLVGEALQLLPAALDEAFAEQQVARQVADERQLRRHGQIGALRAPPPGPPVRDQARVAGEVADGRVDLQQRDLHVINRQIGI